MKKEPTRRLTLNRETLRQLDEVLLQGLAGGSGTFTTTSQPGLTNIDPTQGTGATV
jgi:hypothetical protein